MDPEGPTPAVSDTAMLAELPGNAVDALLAAAGPGSGSTLLATELRQLGGALSRPAPNAGALPMLDGRFVLFGVGIAATAEMGAQAFADARRLVAALRPWSNGRQYLNFAENPGSAAAGFAPSEWQRLQRVRAAADPAGVFVANHPVPVAEPRP
jgi:FAD/FMN-containing dehydrogenase